MSVNAGGLAIVKQRKDLSTLWQAIVANTTEETFWMCEILLNEIEKETGFNGNVSEKSAIGIEK